MDNVITTLVPPMGAPRAKRQRKETPKNTKEVRRSSRLAMLNGGFKDQASANESVGKMINTNLAPQFEAAIINGEEAPPPYLPLNLLQSIGTEHCKMPPTAVSPSALAYDSSNDSV